LPLLQSR